MTIDYNSKVARKLLKAENKNIKHITLVTLLLSTHCVFSQTDNLSIDSYMSKAQNAVKLSLNDLAIQYYKSAIETNPMMAEAYFELGCLYTKMEHYIQAITNLNMAL